MRFCNRTTFYVTLIAVSTFTALPVTASVMQSERFSVSEDAFDVSGGQQESNGISAVSSAGLTAAGSGVSETVRAEAGYTPELEDVFITLTNVADVVMDTPLGGLSGGESNGANTVTVRTNSTAGYQLSVAAETDPAMQSSMSSIANYETNASSTDFDFLTAPTESHFGLSAFGSDVIDEFLSSGVTCGAGSSQRGFCWRGFTSSSTVIAVGSGPTDPAGSDTEILYRVGIGSNVMQLPGTYVATTTITALPL